MKRLFASMLLVFTLCATVAAQKNDDAKNDATDKTRAQTEAPSPVINIRDLLHQQKQTGSNIGKLGDYISPGVMKYVVKDGAVYLDVYGVLVPMPGGGASGCFSLDLPQRIERLRIYIEKLEQEKPPAIRQTEAYAM